MTTRRLIISFFVLYGLLIPLLARDFVEEYTSAAISMVGCSIIIGLLFWSNRAFFLNLLIAFYVFQIYLLRPYISVFEGSLSPESLRYLHNSVRGYDTPDVAAVVYWNLFALLFAWCVGLLIFRSPKRDGPISISRVFTNLDDVIERNGLPFIAACILLFVLNWQSPELGLRGARVGSGEPLFLFGLASLYATSLGCLFFFLREHHAGLRRPPYLLLLLPLLQAGVSLLSGSRSGLFTILVMGLIYWLFLRPDQKWRGMTLIKVAFVSAALMLVSVVGALFAQVLRPLYRSSLNPAEIPAEILGALDYNVVIQNQDLLLRGITELLYRLNHQLAQFYILSDRYIHEPWEHYNPVSTVMRIVNDIMPGVIFENMLTINQLFDYLYYDSIIVYSSEIWSIQGTLYLYFGHFAAPFVVLLLAVIANQLYPSLENAVRTSPAAAVLLVLVMNSILFNGTAERVIPNDLVRTLASFLIFVVIYRSFCLILPTRIKLFSPARN